MNKKSIISIFLMLTCLILISIIIICVLLLTDFINSEKIKGFYYLHCIRYNMEVFLYNPFLNLDGGYSSTTTYYRIDTKKKILYKIEEKNVFSPHASSEEKGIHYSLTQQELSDGVINNLKKYALGETMYEPCNPALSDSFVSIKYHGNKKSYKLSDFDKSDFIFWFSILLYN